MRRLLALLFTLLALPACAAAPAASKPNVLLVMLDDAGYSDVAGFGRNDAPTPTLQQLAQEGVRFTRHYADSTCRPARLALMTGREAATVAQNPDFRGISPQVITLPEALRAAGYATWHIGKWHLGDAVREAWPDRQGFDHWFGFLNQFQLKGPDENGAFTKRPTYTDPFLQGDGSPLQQYRGHLEDILAARVADTIRQADRQRPWFINYWLFAPHHPSTASAEFLKRFPDTPEGKYRALLAQADAAIGQALAALRDTGQLDNTLVIVVSDNGSTNQMMDSNHPFVGVKGEFREGSLRTPLIVRWPDRRGAGRAIGDIVAIQDLYPTILQAAGIAPPQPLDGQALQPLLDGQPLAPRRLVHEIASVGMFNYSLLSPDGRWRSTADELFDLGADPAGSRNVAGREAAQQQHWQRDYAGWRSAKTRVPLQYQRLSATGEARLEGDDSRRAPGYGAWSLAIGATLAANTAGTLADQPGVWSLRRNRDGSFTVQVGDTALASTPAATTGKESCLPVVLSTWYTRSRLHEGSNTAYLQLYVGSQKVLDARLPNPAELTADLSGPTWIGRDAAGGQRWQGTLGVPQVYNTALHEDPAAALDRLADAQQAACLTVPPGK